MGLLRRRVVVSLVVAVLGLVGLATPATAHDRLVSSDPADGATVTAVPDALTLTFSEDVLDTGAQVVITPSGTGQASSQPVQVAGKVVTVPAPSRFPDDTYTVAWRVVSEDGHPVEGTFTFTLATPEAASPSPSASDAASPTPSDVASATASDDVAAQAASPSPAAATGSAATSPLWALVAGVVALAALGGGGIALARRRGLRSFGPPGQD